jgi:formylglycine-generating enzyme required for sulfatase activity
MHRQYSVQAFEQAKYAAAKARYAQPAEKPAHGVTLTKPFYMGKFTVTQEQYQAVMGSNPSHFKGKDNPVEQVSWEDAQAFLKKLSEQTKQALRLPTEAEWEYSCRAGTTTMYYSGDTEADLARVAWYDGNSKSTTHPVGQKEPNKFGLYDMHGNVWQWCQDWYGEDYYGKSDAENPAGPEQGAFRLLRGGSWRNGPMDCRSGRRDRDGPGYRNLYLGFRIVFVPSFRTMILGATQATAWFTYE